jgi:parvulin-like peptidyl-prolyl isomerase
MGEITRRTQLMPDMIEVLFKTPPGQISDPFRNDIGWHVIKVESRAPEHQLTLEEATPPISRAIRIQKTEQAMAAMATRLWREGKVESRIDVSPEPEGSTRAPAGR